MFSFTNSFKNFFKPSTRTNALATYVARTLQSTRDLNTGKCKTCPTFGNSFGPSDVQ